VSNDTPYRSAAGAIFVSDLGMPVLLPVKDKTPPEAGFTGYEGRDPTLEEIDWRIAHRGDHNVGTRLRRELVGIDIDQHGVKTGAESIADVEAIHGLLPQTWRSTARGLDNPSGIYLFVVPDGYAAEDMSESRIGGGFVELIKWNHRFIVTEPSVHPNGGVYEWWAPNGLAFPGGPEFDQVPLLPVEWAQHLTGACVCFRLSVREQIARARRKRSMRSMPRSARQRGAANLIAKLTGDLARMDRDTIRNNTLNSSALYLYERLVVAEQSATYGQVTDAMTTAAMSSGLGSLEIERTLASAWKAASRTVAT
jgi:hypothetical protein